MPYSSTLHQCHCCGATLTEVPEHQAGAWFIRCLDCGAENVLAPTFEIVGWRDAAQTR